MARWLIVGCIVLSSACAPERPPAPDRHDGPASASDAAPAATARFDPATDAFVATYAAERGAFADGRDLAKVPEASRKLVRIKLLAGDEAPAGQVWVADLGAPQDDGSFVLTTVPRGEFEERALGMGLSSAVDLPADGGAGDVPATAPGEVIVYKTAWCGVCKQLEGYLNRKGVAYAAKDIEKDAAAAAELAAKAKAKGVRTNSVPVIDVGGELIVGFDRRRLEALL